MELAEECPKYSVPISQTMWFFLVRPSEAATGNSTTGAVR